VDDIKSCIDCEYHKVISDPDPNDWFCDDDCAVVCTLKQNDERKEYSKYLSDKNPNKCITRSCRPYKIREETTPIPKWCPRGNKNE
jgi:transcription initiation factor TFIIIB Brf1 subunit/transcription initiation factor TFIIB